MVDTLQEVAPEGYEKPRTYRKKARKAFLTIHTEPEATGTNDTESVEEAAAVCRAKVENHP
jgi:hypothetical protein